MAGDGCSGVPLTHFQQTNRTMLLASSSPHSDVQENSSRSMECGHFIKSFNRVTQTTRDVFMLLGSLFLLLFLILSHPSLLLPPAVNLSLSLLFRFDHQMLYICIPDAASQ